MMVYGLRIYVYNLDIAMIMVTVFEKDLFLTIFHQSTGSLWTLIGLGKEKEIQAW